MCCMHAEQMSGALHSVAVHSKGCPSSWSKYNQYIAVIINVARVALVATGDIYDGIAP